jgi:REP element-mobilizing transposase RayT
MPFPELCQACHKSHHATVINACPFCRDVQFPEQVLCDLIRDQDRDEQPFHCEAFRPTLSVVHHDETDTSPMEEDSETTGSMSPKDKWFRAYAVQQLGVDPDLIYAKIQYHVVFSTRQRVQCFSSEHSEQIADLVRQSALPFEQTKVHVVWLASDHLHLYIDTSPDYALDDIVQAITDYLEQAMTNLLPSLQHSHPSFWERAYFAEGIG